MEDKEFFERLKASGVSDAEIENLKVAMSYIEAANAIPDNIDSLIAKVDKYFNNMSVGQTVDAFFALKDKDPEFFKQIVAVQALLGVDESPIATTNIGDALNQILNATGEQKAQLTKQLIARIKGLDAKGKTAFLSETGNLSKEEKEVFLNILKNA